MLVFDGNTFTIDGVTVFSDHADEDRFWYLPRSFPELARRGAANQPNFSLITYRPDDANDDTLSGGGFLMLESILPLPDETRDQILGRLRSFGSGNPQLSPVPLDDGSVKIVALDLEGGGGTTNTSSDGGFTFVESIMGTTKPSMTGDNNALFSLNLSEEGAILMQRIFEEGASNVGVIYDFKYSGLRPALSVEITANFKRVYDHLSMGIDVGAGATINGMKFSLSADIDMAFEELVQNGAIEIKVINFSDADDRSEKETWALNFFKDELMADWFEPTLGAPTPAGETGNSSGGTSPADVAAAAAGAVAGRVVNAATGRSTASTTSAAPPPNPSAALEQLRRRTAAAAAASSRAPAARTPAAPPAPPVTPPASSGDAPEAPPAPPRPPSGDAPAAPPVPPPSTGGTPTPPPTPPAGAPAAPAEEPPSNPSSPSDTSGDAPSGGDTPSEDTDEDGEGDEDGGIKIEAFEVSLGFKLKKVEQIEDKSVTLRYDRQEAVQRSHLPQGPISTLAGGLSGPPFFLEVDLNHAFFRKLDITMDNLVDYDAIGLLKSDVSLEYGRPTHPDEFSRTDVSFPKGGETQATHSFFLNDQLDLGYRVAKQFHFDPGSEWEGRVMSYDFPHEDTIDQTLLINPWDHLGFLEVSVLAGRMDPVMMRHTEVTLSYEGGGWSTSKVFIVRPDSEVQHWKLRLDDPTITDFSYSMVHHLADGTTKEGASGVNSGTTVLVDDPFDDAIEVMFLANFDAAVAQQVFLTITYDDPANDYERSETLTFMNTSTAPQSIRFARFDNGPEDIAVRAMVMGVNNSVTRHATVMTSEPIVPITELLV